MEQKLTKKKDSAAEYQFIAEIGKSCKKWRRSITQCLAAGDQTGGSGDPPAEALQIAARINTATGLSRQLMEQWDKSIKWFSISDFLSSILFDFVKFLVVHNLV